MFLFMIFVTTTIIYSQNPCPGVPTVTYAGQTYNTVQIGNQCWLKENLNVGTMIKGSIDQTNNGKIEKYCYNDDSTNCAKFGGLYKWAEAVQYKNGYTDSISTFIGNVQGICPSGWHMPSNSEFQTLEMVANNDGNALKAIGQGNAQYSGAGTNISGFSALLAGYLDHGGSFSSLGYDAFFWSSTKYDVYNINGMILSYAGSDIGLYDNGMNEAYSVRCIKDESSINNGKVIHVPKDYSTIQKGINAANYQDTVLVEAGTYYEIITMKANTLLIGSGFENTVIDGKGVGNGDGSVVVGADNCLIKGFTIRNANLEYSSNLGAGIDGGFYSFTIKENLITNCRIGIVADGTCLIERNLIFKNTGLAGITASSTAIITNNTIVNNDARGIQFSGDSPNIINNIVVGNTDKGIANFGSGNISVKSNDVFNNGQNYYGLHDQTGLNGNISDDPIFVKPDSNNFHLQYSSPCIDKGDSQSEIDPDGTRADMGAFYYAHSTVGVNNKYDLPTKFSLSQNYPNPFNPTTTINYSVPKSGHVSLKVYDLLGREATALVNENKSVGNYTVQFNASKLVSGVYFYRMQAGDFVQTKKLLLIK